METLEYDYLVIGAGAMGMAFTDELLSSTNGLTVLLADRNSQPGGHWLNSYSYVHLHQPSHFYGVNSKKLEKAPPRPEGDNELASGHEVVTYFQEVLKGWQDSGRLRFMPKCEVDESGHRITSLVEPGLSWEVKARRKVVDATYMKVEIPSLTPPKYRVAPGAEVVPPNSLPSLTKPRESYVVIGAGKTGMDAVLWLLHHGVAPERIRWVMPRDPWMFNRKMVQPGGIIFTKFPESVEHFKVLSNKDPNSVPAILQRGDEAMRQEALARERIGTIFRIDESVWPEAFQCATVSEAELVELRRVKKNIIRMGHVQEVGLDRLLLDGGEVATGEGVLHVDCSADALSKRPAVPIWSPERITLQPVRMCQQVASAAMIGFVEAKFPDDEAKKNQIFVPCPHPNCFKDWLVSSLIQERNNAIFAKNGGMRWLMKSRLSMEAHAGVLPPLRWLAGRFLRRLSKPQAKL